MILASAVVPEVENPLAQLYKVPQNQEGFFAEAMSNSGLLILQRMAFSYVDWPMPRNPSMNL